MKRKLFSVVLSVFAMLLLMGAAANPRPAAALLAEEESVAPKEMTLETEAQSIHERFAKAAPAATGTDPLVVTEEEMEYDTPISNESSTLDSKLLIDGQPAPLALGKYYQKGVTYVSLASMAQEMEPTAQVSWDGSTMTVTTGQLTLTAQAGKLYLIANGRYLYVPETIQLSESGQLSAPLWAIIRAFDGTMSYNMKTGVVTVTRGTGAIASGDSFYDTEDLFWLSRIIYRESGNQSLEGQMAVGNVVLNRVASPTFPNTVESVLAQKNQFSCYKSGALAKTTPSQSSIIAAKLVMDGGVVEETSGELFFGSGVNSWAARNKRHIATLGDHEFYG